MNSTRDTLHTAVAYIVSLVAIAAWLSVAVQVARLIGGAA